jgi:hypothetical protein
MTLKVVVDAGHRILAFAVLPDIAGSEGGARPALTARPLPGPGHREFDVLVPAQHAKRALREHLRALHASAAGVVYRA